MRIKTLVMSGTAATVIASCGQMDRAPKQWITIDNEAASALRQNFPESAELIAVSKETSVLLLEPEGQGEISDFMHKKFNRCGGYFAFDSEREAIDFGTSQEEAAPVPEITYTLDQQAVVGPLVETVQARQILETMTNLSTFHNRYYTAASGSESQNWVKAKWEELGNGRSDFSVEMFTHTGWPQPSVIATIEGSEFPNEIVVIGGHGDSISGQWSRESSRAPGADDNASGIASITESLRVLMANGWKPKRTVKFMSYAAEEVGLKGSKEIAKAFASAGRQVIGVMQLDMTAFNGANKIGLMRDFTSNALSDFTTKLIDQYVLSGWMNDKCGYACSDHASWHSSGFPAVMPFESPFDNSNPKIHTANDTLQNADSSGVHPAKFAKLALSYLVEVAK